MRTNMLPGLVGALQANASRQQERVRLFEMGLCFQPAADAGLEREAGDLSGDLSVVRQQPMLAIVLSGACVPEGWNQGRDDVDFFDIKGLMEQVFEWAGLVDVSYALRRDDVMHPGQSATVLVAGRPVGRLGRLHPEVETRLDVPRPIYFLEVEAEAVLQRGTRKYQAFSRYPSVRRDLALVVDEQVTVELNGKTVIREAHLPGMPPGPQSRRRAPKSPHRGRHHR